MSVKTKKIEKEFVLSDSSVNVYGFRLLTEGYMIDEYKRNPIGYHMHDRNSGVVVKWEELRVDGDAVKGKPVINMSNARGQQTVEEIENGFLNAASVGHIVAIEISEDPKLMQPGQTGPTITKWYNRECSLCDIPGNMNALALYDKDGNEIKLTDFKIQKLNMEKIFLTAEQLTKIGLKADAKQTDVDTTIDALLAKGATVDDLTAQLTTANTAKKTAEDALTALTATTAKDKVKAIGDKAVADKKMTVELRAKFDKKFENDAEGYQDLVDSMKPFTSVVEQLNADTIPTDNAELNKLLAQSGDELFGNGGFAKLKAINLAAYNKKYKEWTGEEAPKEEE
jgi:hypothetical protein